jgi:hypothetical protein
MPLEKSSGLPTWIRILPRKFAAPASRNDFAKRRGVGERADFPFAADGTQPCLTVIAVGGTRAHHDGMPELHKFAGDGIAHHAGTEHCDFHGFSFLVIGWSGYCRR